MIKKIIGYSLMVVVVGAVLSLYLNRNYFDKQGNIYDVSSTPVTKNIQNPPTEVISNTGSQQLSGDIFSGSAINGDDAIVGNETIPLCRNDLNPVSVIDIDKVVKNCTEKKKEGQEVTDLGGVPPTYIMANDSAGLVLYDNNEKKDILCRDGKDNFYVRELTSIVDQNDDINSYVSFPPYQLEPIIKVSKMRILDEIAYAMYPDNMFCELGEYSEYLGQKQIDPDCMDMNESWARSDQGYYFVAGYRNDMPGKLLYVINGKIYNPGESNINDHEENELGQGRWQFITVKDNKIIVKRMKDEKHYPWKDNNSSINPSTYTLQTCKIAL